MQRERDRHREGLDNSAFEDALRNSKYFTRTTIGNRVLTYVLKVIQHPERARACGSGPKCSADRRPVDPPPTVRLLVFERRNGLQIDVTFSYEARFFLFATLEAAPSRKNLRYALLTGTPVSSGNYLGNLGNLQPAIYFVFPGLSVKYEGEYRLCFNLYEMISKPEDRDATGDELNLNKARTEAHQEEAATQYDEVIWRTEIMSSNFTVFNAKRFPGLAESTSLSRLLAEQGALLRLRRDVRVRRRDIRDEPNFEETVFQESVLKPDRCGSPGEDSTYSLRKDSMSSAVTIKDHLPLYPFNLDFLSVSSMSSDNLNLQHMGEAEAPRRQRERLANSPRPKHLRHHTLNRPIITSPSQRGFNRLLGAREPMSQKNDESTRTTGPLDRKYLGDTTESKSRREDFLEIEEDKHSDTDVLRVPPKSATYPYLGHSPRMREAHVVQYDATTDTKTKSVMSKEAIWSNFIKILPPAIGVGTSHLQRSALESSISVADDPVAEKLLDDDGISLNYPSSARKKNRRKQRSKSEVKPSIPDPKLELEPMAIAGDGVLLSHAVKRAAQEWWLFHSSQSWDHILPQKILTTNPGRLGHTIFSCWYQDLVASLKSSHSVHGDWLCFLGPSADHKAEAKLVGQLVDDIYTRLGKALNGSVKRIPAVASTTTETSASGTTPTPTSLQSARFNVKRRDRGDSAPEDRLNDDDPDKNDRPKRTKKNADQYSRYFICTEFAAGQDPVCPSCFFGAWPSVERLKHDHLIKVHRFDTTLLRVDKGGTESEKWWRIFEKLHPGFRETNPSTFIPGPLWEDRVAQNAYNRVLSEAMKEAECIRQRGTQTLISQFQDLLNQQQSLERRELHQMVSNLMYSDIRNMTVIDSSTPSREIERQSDTAQNAARNGEHCNGDTMTTALLQQPDVNATHSSTPEELFDPCLFSGPSPLFSSNGPSLDSYLLPALHDDNILSSRHLIADNLGTNAYPAYAGPVNSPFNVPALQIHPPSTAMSTAASSETMSGNDHSPGPISSFNNDDGHQQPFGKVCRCRFHSLECSKSCTESGIEWCVGCSGWFSWSEMAKPFFQH